MNRKEFLKISGLLGLTLPLQTMRAQGRRQDSRSSKTVLIIGAGAAGMSAGYLLDQLGINYKILEASNTYGGRVKRTTTFADFPIPLGAEWLHVSKNELANIVNSASTTIKTKLKGYSGEEQVGYYEDGHLSYASLAEGLGDDFADLKFVNSTWFDFFDEYIVPSIRRSMQFDTQIASIDYLGDQVVATDSIGSTYEADSVIVTVPLKVLQNGTIRFHPALPNYKRDAIQEAPIWGGLKAFLEFTNKFYPTYLAFPDSETRAGQRLYFDAAHAQNSSSNVLGLFAVGEQAKAYQRKSESDQLDYILQELDQVFDGEASRSYKKHIIQNWDNEPYIQSAYLADVAASYISSDMFTPVENKLYFAGEAYTYEDDWGGVHNATQSARRVVEKVINS